MKEYFEWLMDQVSPSNGGPGFEKHSQLFYILHEKKFYSMFPHDENRGEDGRVLRHEYAQEMGCPVNDIWSDEASMLEVMVALARRMTLTMEGFVRWNEPARWMYEMLDNLRLLTFDDFTLSQCKDQLYLVDDILERWLSRNYEANGSGGMFPVPDCTDDQRLVEIWDQCQHYLFERYQKAILREN